jgi:hypothetical protein
MAADPTLNDCYGGGILPQRVSGFGRSRSSPNASAPDGEVVTTPHSC